MISLRIGQGRDVHQLAENRPLIIGGVTIPYEKGLLGHSDADVLLHALCDALLGAAALGDIGTHFSDADAQYKNIDSRFLLRNVRQLLRERNYCIIISMRPSSRRRQKWRRIFRRWLQTSRRISAFPTVRSMSKPRPPNILARSGARKALQRRLFA